MKKIILPVFILLALVQWLVPGKIIWNREKVLKNGKEWRFETEPVDPSDPFRGRYIALNFMESEFRKRTNADLFPGQDIFVLLVQDKYGFAKIDDVLTKEPGRNIDYLKAKVRYSYTNSDTALIHIEYPFEEFYMDEYKAPKAEKIYSQSTRDTTKKTYALIKVWKGLPAIENVFVGNTPISDLIKP